MVFPRPRRPHRPRHNRPQVDPLESRRLLAAELSWGPTSVSGALFVPGQTATITANVRNFGSVGVAAGSVVVEFRYLEIGFRSQLGEDAFTDPASVSLSSA